MSVRSGQSVTVVFPTQNPSTGAATNADSTPTGTLYVNGTANAATVTVTNIDTGRYKAAVTLPTLSIGDVVDLSVAATVNSVAGKGTVWRDTCDIAIDSAGNAAADVKKWNGTAAVTGAVPAVAAGDPGGLPVLNAFTGLLNTNAAYIGGDNASPGVFNYYMAGMSALSVSAATSSTLTVSGAVATAGYYPRGTVLVIVSGTGAKQSRVASSYAGSGVFNVTPNWATTPDNTSIALVLPPGDDVAGVLAGGVSVTTGGIVTGSIASGALNGKGDWLLSSSYTAPDNTTIAAIKTDTGTLLTRVTSTLFSGITSLGKWLGAIAGKTADTATRAEIQATPAGATYNETTDSQEALRDRGDSGAWGVAGSGSLTVEQDEKLTAAYNQTLLISSGGFYVVNRLNNGNLTIFQGETWSFAEGTHHTITRQSGDTWPTDLTDYTITSTITKTLANTNTGSLSTLAMPCTITQATGASQSFYIEAGTSTASLALGEGTRGYDWTVSAAKGTNVAVLVAGTASVKRRL